MTWKKALSMFAVVILAAVSYARAEVLCASRFSGALSLRAQCMVYETRIDPVALGLQGPPGPGALVVKDANGKVVGAYVMAFGAPADYAVRRIGSDVIRVPVNEGGGVNSIDSISLYYESSDCSGSALWPADDLRSMVRDAYIWSGVAYYPARPYDTRTVQSGLLFPSPEDGCLSIGGIFSSPDRCCLQVGYTGIFAVAGTLDLSTFVPPFVVEFP